MDPKEKRKKEREAREERMERFKEEAQEGRLPKEVNARGEQQFGNEGRPRSEEDPEALQTRE